MRVQCTACQSILNSTRPVPVGSRARCPRCGATFRVTAEVPAEAVKPPVKQAEPKGTSEAVATDPVPVAELVEEEAVPDAELDEEEAIPALVHAEKKRGSSVGLWVCVAAILFAFLFGGGAVLYYMVSKGRVALALAGGDALTGWEPDSVLVGYLDDEIKLTPLDNLHIRVSQKAPTQSRADNTGRWWRITQLGSGVDGEGTNLNVYILDKPAHFENNPIFLRIYLHNLLPKASNEQFGKINGMDFTRVRTEEEHNYKGFGYYGVVYDHIVVFTSSEPENHWPRLKLAESAVLTLRKD
jgi:hypothetical protein